MAEDTGARSVRAALQIGLSKGDQVQVALDGLEGLGVAQRLKEQGNVTAAVPTVACSVSQGAAGNVNVGTHLWAYTWVTNGVESSPSPTFSFAITSAAAHASMTAVAVGPTGTTSRKIYRSVIATAPLLLVGTIADNSTTTFDDNVADGSLGAAAPTGQPEADTYQEHGRRGLWGGAAI